LLPATSVAAIARVTLRCTQDDLRTRLDAYAREAARNHPAGLRELVADGDEKLALYALELLTPVAGKLRAPIAALAFDHASAAVRSVAARHLGEVADEHSVRRLVQRTGDRALRMRSTEEQLEVYVALARTQHPIALARVEERLANRTGGLAAKLTALLRREP